MNIVSGTPIHKIEQLQLGNVYPILNQSETTFKTDIKVDTDFELKTDKISNISKDIEISDCGINNLKVDVIESKTGNEVIIPNLKTDKITSNNIQTQKITSFDDRRVEIDRCLINRFFTREIIPYEDYIILSGNVNISKNFMLTVNLISTDKINDISFNGTNLSVDLNKKLTYNNEEIATKTYVNDSIIAYKKRILKTQRFDNPETTFDFYIGDIAKMSDIVNMKVNLYSSDGMYGYVSVYTKISNNGLFNRYKRSSESSIGEYSMDSMYEHRYGLIIFFLHETAPDYVIATVSED